MTQQQQAPRPRWLSVAMMTLTTLMLIAAIVSFILRDPGAGDAFLAIMALFCVVALTGSVVSRNRALAVVRASENDQQAHHH
jgi:hypothetical protein